MIKHLTQNRERSYAEYSPSIFHTPRLIERDLSHGEWFFSDSKKHCPPHIQLEAEHGTGNIKRD